MKIALCQLAADWSDDDATLARVESYAGEAARAGAGLLVLPELTLAGVLGEAVPTGPRCTRLEEIARATGVAIVAGVGAATLDGRPVSAALGVFPSARRAVVHPHDRGRVLRVRKKPVSLVMGGEFWRANEVRGVLAHGYLPPVLVALLGDHARSPLERAREIAEDGVTVIACNAAAPMGRGGSCVVMANGEIATVLGHEERLAVVNMVRLRTLPAGMCTTPASWAALSEEDRSELIFAVVGLIRASQVIERQATARVAARRIRRLWRATLFGAFWLELSARDRDEVVRAVLDDARAVELYLEQLMAAERDVVARDGLTDVKARELLSQPHSLESALDGLIAWSRRTPVTYETEPHRAILRRALGVERRRALAQDKGLSPRDLEAGFALKVAGLRAEPASIYYLTQPYLQTVARNALRDVARGARAVQVASRSGTETPQFAGLAVEQLECLDRLRDALSQPERDVLELQLDGVTDVDALARECSMGIDEVRAAQTAIHQRYAQLSTAP